MSEAQLLLPISIEDIEMVPWVRIYRETRKWFSPPDQWRDHNIALESRYTVSSS